MRPHLLPRVITLLAELADHRLDVGKGTVCRIGPPLVLLNCAHLDPNLFPSLLGELLHVPLDELHLGIQVRVSLLRIFKLLFKLEVLHL